MSQDPVSRFNTLLSSHSFVFLVVYGGHWGPFCMSYLKALSTLSPSLIATHSGSIVCVTSEPETHLPATRATSGYTGDVIVDPDNALVAHLRQKGWVDVHISEKKGYEHGMAQPAVLVLRPKAVGEGKVDVLYSGAIVPSLMHLHGAKDRPILSEVWSKIVEPKLDGQRAKIDESRIGTTTAFGTLKGKIFG